MSEDEIAALMDGPNSKANKKNFLHDHKLSPEDVLRSGIRLSVLLWLDTNVFNDTDLDTFDIQKVLQRVSCTDDNWKYFIYIASEKNLIARQHLDSLLLPEGPGPRTDMTTISGTDLEARATATASLVTCARNAARILIDELSRPLLSQSHAVPGPVQPLPIAFRCFRVLRTIWQLEMMVLDVDGNDRC